jgi:hypothetical protein
MTNASAGNSGWDWITLANENGDVHSPAAGKGWLVPAEIRLRNGRLLYHPFGRPPRMPVTMSPGSSLLAEFLSLVDAPDEKLVSFASRRGVLGLCWHGLPYPHRALTGELPWNRMVNCFPGRLRRGSTPGGRPDYWLWEPLWAWRRYTQVARATLNIVAELRQGRSGRREDWLVLFPFSPADVSSSTEPSLRSIDKNPWHYIDSVLEDWFASRPVRLSFTLSDEGQLGIDLDQTTGSLFEYLRVQLAFAIGRGGGLAMCASCGRLYSPRRRPNPNRLCYCQKCGRAAATRAASARYRQREREGK